MSRRILDPHSLLITLAILIFIWMLNLVRLNLHYLDPFHNGLKDYDVTDIVYANLSEDRHPPLTDIIIVNSGQPDRSRIAALVNKLDTAGAKVIGLDFYFEGLTDTAADTALREAISLPRVVLACTLEDTELTDDRIEGIGGVDPFFREAATLGYGNFPTNETKTLRVVSPRERIGDRVVPAFSTAVLSVYDSVKHRAYLDRDNEVEQIYYTGHRDNFLFNNLDRMLDSMTTAEVRATCAGRIVLIGYAPEEQWANPLLDGHYTPINPSYGTKSIPDMFGIVVHANVVRMVLEGNFVRVVPWWLATVLSVLICYLNVRWFRWLYRRFHQAFHGITRLIQLLEFVTIFFLLALLFYYFRLRVDLAVGILGVLLAYDFVMIYQSLVLPRFGPLRRFSPEAAATDTATAGADAGAMTSFEADVGTAEATDPDVDSIPAVATDGNSVSVDADAKEEAAESVNAGKPTATERADADEKTVEEQS